MIVYGEAEREAEPRALLRAIAAALAEMAGQASPSHDALRRELIALGETEAALGDALCPEIERIIPPLEGLRRAAIALGKAVWLSWQGGASKATSACAAVAASDLARLAEESWPARVRLRPPEGYAHYALYPESYGEAAARIASDRNPASALVIGIRSIGTSLSALVAAVLEERRIPVRSWCVRPRGHPFSRSLALGADVRQAWEAAARQGSIALVVDEGPGLSGSSFLGTAAALEQAGFPEERVILMPSWDAPAPAMAPQAAARRWERAIKCPAEAGQPWWRQGLPRGDIEDLSAGGWRKLLMADTRDWPAVQPQHERRKYLVSREDGSRRLWKFAGLGSYGSARHERALALAGAGFSPAAHALQDGFLVQDFVPGRPLRARDIDARLAARMLDYLSFRARAFPTGRSARAAELAEMIRVNLREGLGPEWAAAADRLLEQAEALSETGTVAVDGRMMPHEWLDTSAGVLKVDAVDHADDHFFPRDQDIAWDVAGLAAEFRLDRALELELAEKLAARIGDRGLPRRIPFYAVAYRAFHLGYADLASSALGTGDPDAKRFRRRASRFRTQLHGWLGLKPEMPKSRTLISGHTPRSSR
ncbi:MAG: hypothetical protein K0S81_2681 [Rhodospirillales bacterium]|nr:hypothetical protein [Rhodospirillales bacterium]